jgi:hypothetical protein
MVSVTALTAPLAPLPLDELDEAARVLRERLAVAAERLRDRALAGDALVDLDFADEEDDRLAAVDLLPEPALRLLAWVGRPLDERALEATMGPSFLGGLQALYPGHGIAHARSHGAQRRRLTAPRAAVSTSPASAECAPIPARPWLRAWA